MRAGAADYLEKGRMTTAELERAVRYAVQQRHARDQQRRLAEAEAANVAKDQFLAMLSHELRTPLMAITGWIEVLDDPKADARERAEAVDAVRRNAWHQAALVNDLLDTAGMLSGKLALTPERIDWPTLCREAAGSLGAAVKPRAVTIEVEAEATPADAPPFLGDPKRLRQVLYNLLQNAAKFSDDGGAGRAAAGPAAGPGAGHRPRRRQGDHARPAAARSSTASARPRAARRPTAGWGSG